jgi:hypothetical protein
MREGQGAAPDPLKARLENPGRIRRKRGGVDRDLHAAFGAGLELHGAVDQREDGVVATDADIAAGLHLGAALADDDVAGDHGLAAELLDAETTARGIAAVAGRAACFLMCHCLNSS